MSSSSLVSNAISGTPTSPTASPSTTTSSTGGSHSIWSTNGGPPLMLVCLAAGLLFGALLCLMILRRVQGRRGTPAPRSSPIDFYRSIFSDLDSDVPQIWDMHVDHAAWHTKRHSDLHLADILPISARVIPSLQSTSLSNVDLDFLTPTQRIVHCIRKTFSDLFNNFGSLHTPPHRDGESRESPREASDPDKIQIAVAICMPSPHHRATCEVTEGSLMPEYCIGLVAYDFEPKPS